MSSHPVIKRMVVYANVRCGELMHRLHDATSTYKADVINRPEEHPSFTDFWESIGSVWDSSAYDDIGEQCQRFECFVTDDHLDNADVAYAIHSKKIPVLSLRPPGDAVRVMRKVPALFSDTRTLQVDGAAQAISRYFVFPEETGRVFVIEGGDGAGKQTQTEMLVARLENEGRMVHTMDFPNDGFPSGKIVREILAGRRGYLKDINPNSFASLYSFNRWEALPILQYWVQRGSNIVLDRYMTANFGYQARLINESDRKTEIGRLETFETNYLQLPRAHRVIYMNLSPAIAYLAMRGDATRKELDIYEKQSIANKESIRSSFLWCCDNLSGWSSVKCASDDDNHRFSREEIHETIYNRWKDDFR